MFGEKCPKCTRKVSKKFDLCPHCGKNLVGEDSQDYGFLGKNDIMGDDLKLPFGFNALMKPLMKELGKQMVALDREMKKEVKEGKEFKPVTRMNGFNIHIGIPGQKPIRITSNVPMGNQMGQTQKPIAKLVLPKLDSKKLEGSKDFDREEPRTSVRRLSDRIIYEIELPNVKSMEDINISVLEDGIEIKAISDDVLFVKSINVRILVVRL